MKKLLVFHPALMPYRVDFFRYLQAHFQLSLYFTTAKNTNQELDQAVLIGRLGFRPHYWLTGFKMGRRIIRLGMGKIIAEERPDLVFAPEFTFITLSILLARIFSPKKYKVYVLCDDSYPIASGGRKGIRRLIRDVVLKQIDGLVLTSERVKNWYAARYPDLEYVVFPILQEETLFRKRLENSLPLSRRLVDTFGLRDKKVFMYVGRFAPVKNLPFLLQAFARYSPTHPEAILVMVGEGEQKSILEQLAFRLGISSRVCFAGHYEDDALLAWYNIGQVLVLPSVYEPFGCVVNEALLGGLYVLASTEVGANGLLSEASGRVFSLSSTADLEACLAEYGDRIEPVTMPLRLKRNLLSLSFREEFEKIKALACIP